MAAFVLDRQQILERLGGDEEIYAIMAETYIEDVDCNCAALAAALAADDLRSLQREAHTIKGLLAGFADPDGAAVAQALEHRLRRGELAELAAAVDGLQQRLQAVKRALLADLAAR